MTLNQASIDLIKEYEGLECTAYQDAVGVWTIGYGHTDAAGAPSVIKGMTITEAKAEAMLARDLAQYEAAVDAAVKVSLSENERGALVSLCYNIGPNAFRRSTALLRLNAGDYNGAAEAMTWWNKAGGKVLRGLVRRREAERALFLTEAASLNVSEAQPAGPVTGGEQKSVTRSKTSWLGGLTLTGALAYIGDIRKTLPEAADYLPYALAVVGLLIIVNRWNEARKGEH